MASQRKPDKLSKENDGPPEVVNLLVSMFGGVLPVAIIKSIGFNCQWNVDSASNILAELSSVGGDNVKPKSKKKPSPATNINSVSYGIPAEEDDDDDADVLIENDAGQQSENYNSIPWLERSNSTNPFRRDVPVASNYPLREDRRGPRFRNKTPTGRTTPTGKHTPVNKPGPGAGKNFTPHPNYGAAVAKNFSSVVKIPPPPLVNRAPPEKAMMHVQNRSKKEIELDRVREHIRSGAKVLVILRGLPGSGKSHLARLIVTTTINEDPQRFIYSTDEYFLRNGTYQFNPNMLGDAHEWNKRRVFEAMMLGMSPIVVDNTNTEMWEMKPYAGFAVQYGYAVEIMEPLTVWIFNPPELARRNIHGVPRAKIEGMLERYEKKITPEKLFSIYGLNYNAKNQPPQPRLYPPMSRNIRPLFAIPPEIARKPTAPLNANTQTVVNAAANGQTSETSSTISKSESMHSILTNDDSSDNESDSGNNPYGSRRDLLSEDFENDGNEYVLISPENGANYQQPIGASEENIDLINFNDIDQPDDKHLYSNDLINLENKGTQRQATANNESSSSVREMTARLIDSCEAILKSVTSGANKTQSVPVTDFPQIDLSAWQTTKEALASWELVDEPQVKIPPLKKYNEPQPQRQTSRQIPSEYSSSKSDSITNTTSADFNLLKEHFHETSDYKIVPTRSRVIGENYPSPLPRSPTKVHVLDKSTMTGQENMLAAALSRTRCNNEDQHFSELLHLFPKTRKDVLKEMFDKCNGDINWAVDLLLDCNPDTLESANDNQQQPMNIDTNTDPSQHVHSSECNCASDYETQPYISEQKLTVLSAEQTVPSSPEIKKIAKQRPEISEEILQLKKQFENQFKIDDTHYSGYLLNVRNRKHGDPVILPSTSREEPSASSMYYDSPSDTVHELPTEGESEESSEEEMIEMNVGANFVEELQRTFGGDDLEYPQGLQPVMSLPASLLRQLHAYWLESVYQQMEVQSAIIAGMVREDEEFARKLQEKEATGEQRSVVPDLQEIMDMEIALAIYRTDQEQWKKETPDDLASRMKRQKLFDTFPNLDKTILVEILQAHNNSFEQTCEVLMASVGQEAIQLDESGEIRTASGSAELQKQKELIEKAKTEYIQAKKLENATPKKVVKQSSSDESDSCSHEDTAEYYRQQAAHHLKMRQQCFNKAQAAFQKGSTQVAMYYSDIAKMHIQKYEQANSLAASAFLSAHSMKQQNSKTLDLHFLYVKEAQQALALFIDNQLSKLKENNKSKETLFIITGRGRNSRDGVPHIKLAVKRCLKDRCLEFVEMNPGLLKVTIKKHSKMTNDLK
ncbi:hypothetical protein CBL_07661 [Carabus blaptoides fortunei]